MTEAQLQAAILKALNRQPDVLAFRNHVGFAQVKDKHGTRPQRFGLHPGSSDIVAIVAPHGHWLCLEVKTPKGRVSEAQEKWLALMKKMGATAAVVRSVEDAMAAVRTARL